MRLSTEDQFAKGTLSSLLAEGGEVEVSRELHSGSRLVDVSFTPHPNAATVLDPLGCLGRMAAQPCLIEPFSIAARRTSIHICLLKLEMVRAEQVRIARREKRPLGSLPQFQLWMLFSSCCKKVRRAFGAQQMPSKWPDGFFFLPSAHGAAIIGIKQLPRTRETLLLRLLGRGETQAQAMKELSELPEEDPLKEIVLRQIPTWIMMLQDARCRSARDKEITMNLQKYQELAAAKERQILENGIQEGLRRGRQEGIQKGLQRGLQKGIQRGLQKGIQRGLQKGKEEGLTLARDADRRLIETMLAHRYGQVDQELQRLIPSLLDLAPEDLGTVLLTLPREALLARFSASE